MLTAVLLLLASAQDPVTDGLVVDPSARFRLATVVLPTRRPVYEHLDDVFELPPRIEPEVVSLGDTRFTATVPIEAVAIISCDRRPVDFEVGCGPPEVHLDECEGELIADHTFLAPVVALGEPVVVDLPWSRDASGLGMSVTAGGSGRVVDAGGVPVPGVEIHLTSLEASRAPKHLAAFATTGPEGRWEREAVQARFCRSASAPAPEPVTEYLALRKHPSHAWQVFPRVEGGTLFLAEPALLSVYLVDENGEPVEGSDLRLGPATIAAPGLFDLPGPVAPDPEVALRDLGGWEISGLPRGVYRVYARAPGHAPAAAGIDLSSGHRELLLTLPRAAALSVSVLSADGSPAAGARVTVVAAGGDMPIDGATADASGELVIDRAPAAGPLLLHAEHPLLGSAEITWADGPREVTLTLSGEPTPPRTAGTWGALHDRLFAE